MGSFNWIIKEWVVSVEKIWTIGAIRGSNWSYDDLKNTLEAVGRVEMKGSGNGLKNRTILQVRVARQQVVSL